MSDSSDRQERHLAKALFRYRLIAEAAEAPEEDRARLLREQSKKDEVLPSGTVRPVPLRTLQRWLRRYQLQGLEGLLPKVRKDKGRTRAISKVVLELAIQLRKEGTHRSTPTLIDIMERDGKIAPGSVQRSTLDRHLDRADASRRRLQVLGVKRHVRLSFPLPLDFMLGDFHDGPYVVTDGGELRRAKLTAFIDHCSRHVPESRYVLSEDLMAVRRSFRLLCTKSGLADKLYCDRGPGYQAGRFHFACAQLRVRLMHSRPYTSEGRGCIERFNRTVKDAFETEVRLRREPVTLSQLNEFWRAWLEERYERRAHSETGEPPWERWQRLIEKREVRYPDPVLLDEVLRLRARRKVHEKTSTVEVCGVAFVTDTALRKRWVDVLFDPHDLSSVLIYYDGRRIQRATPQVPGEAPVSAPPTPTPTAQSVDYLELLRRDHGRRRSAEVATIRFTAVRKDDQALTIGRLCERLRACCGQPLGEIEAELAATALEALAPVEIAIADVALKTAVATLGTGLHASHYLEALREHVLRARRKGNP